MYYDVLQCWLSSFVLRMLRGLNNRAACYAQLKRRLAELRRLLRLLLLLLLLLLFLLFLLLSLLLLLL